MSEFSDLMGSPDPLEAEPLTTPATQPARKSEYRSLLDGPTPQDAALGSSLLGATTTTPDAHAKAMDIGRTIGSPADAVAGNKEAEQMARLQKLRAALGDAPKLAKLLAEDPDLAKISADDLERLAPVEKTLSFTGALGRGVDVLQGYGFQFLEATGEAAGLDSLTEVGRAGRLRNRAEAAAYGERSAFLDIRSAGDFGQYAKELFGEQLPVMAPGIAGGLAGAAAGSVVPGVGTVIGGIIGAFIPSFVLGVGSMQGAVKEKDEEAVAPGTVFGAGALIGILDSALPTKVGSTLVRLFGREGTEQVFRLTARKLAADTAKGATLEGATEAAQEGIEEVAASLATGQDIDPRALAEQMIEGFAAGFLMGGTVGAGADVVGTLRQNRAKAAQSAQDAAIVEQLVKGTADSTLRERSPDAFARVMAAQTQGTPVETFYVPAARIAELYQESAPFSEADDPLNQIEGLREQFTEALAVGGDIEISAADYLTHIAPTPVHGQLKNDVRVNRNGWSVNDAKAYAENPEREAELQALVERLAIENEGAAVGQKVYDDVYKQLMDTGRYTAEQAAAQATVMREHYLARAVRRGAGEDADALYLRDQLRIFGPGALARVQRDDLDLVIARLKSGEQVRTAKTPVLDIVRTKGGVKPGSKLASELNAIGITNRTHPGLFRKDGIGDVDNWVLSEHPVLAENGVRADETGYADRQAVLDALAAEAGGRGTALLTQDEREQRARLDEPVAVLAEQLEAAGLDPNAMSADEIKAWVRGESRIAPEPEPDAQGVLLQAQRAGYQGADTGEAAEWLAAVGKGLDMSPEARMARARAMGFSDTVFYHATTADVAAFDLKAAGTGANAGNAEKAVFLTDNPAVAETYLGGVFVRTDAPDAVAHGVEDLGGGVGRTYTPGSRIMPVLVRDLDRFEGWDMGGGMYDAAEMKQMLRDARKAKAPGVVFENFRDPGIMSTGRPKASTVVAVLDPRAIRSPFAAFDPDRAGEAGLLFQTETRPGAGTELFQWAAAPLRRLPNGKISLREHVGAVDTQALRNLPAEARERYEAASDNRAWSDQTLPVRALIATQEGVDPDFRAAAERYQEDDLPIVVKHGGQYFVEDGHHRLMAQIVAGPTARVHVIDLDLPGAGAELFQSVYHGSPHIFDRFSTAAIGTGEGAQAYGFGLYFASKKEIAAYYRETLAGHRFAYDGREIAQALDPGRPISEQMTPFDHAVELVGRFDGSVDRAQAEAEAELAYERGRPSRGRSKAAKFYAATVAALKAGEVDPAKVTRAPGGRLYTVEIPDDGAYLLWDKPLSEQPEAVKAALSSLGLGSKDVSHLRVEPYDTGSETLGIRYRVVDGNGQDVAGFPFKTAAKAQEQIDAMAEVDPNRTGHLFYSDLSKRLGSDRAASEALLAAGVRGIKYLDQGSRAASEGSYNYVVFADADAVITAYEQRQRGGGVRGSFLPARAQDPYSNPANIIRLTQNADLSTFLHESGHFFLFQLIDDSFDPAATPEAQIALRKDLQTILDHAGIKIDVNAATADQVHAAMTREAHELWARSFEAFLMEGKAPSAALRDAFTRFSAWLIRIYRKLSGIPDYRKNLTPEVRAVMDRLLATDDAIADARASSAFRVPSGLRAVLTEKEQRDLERLTEQANAEARRELQGRVMKELARERTAEWKKERERTRAEVESDVRRRPVYQAYNILRNGITADGTPLVDEDGNPRKLKLDRRLLELDYGRDVLRLLPKGITAAKDGISHHVFAGMMGFKSSDELRDALMNLRPMREVIEEETDAAMRQRHGDMTTDGRIAEDALEVIANDKQLELAHMQARALRRLAAQTLAKAAERDVSQKGAASAAENRTAVIEAEADAAAVAAAGVPAEGVTGVQAEAELARATAAASVGQRRAQGAALRQVRGIQSGIDLQAIKAAAKRAMAGKLVQEARAEKYRAQAARLGRQVEQAIAARDYQKAATLKEQQLINLALAKEAQEVQAQVEKARKRWRRLSRPDSKLAATQDMDFVGAARAILSRFGLSSPQAGFDQQVWFQKLEETDPAGARDMRDMIEAATAGAKPWQQLSVDNFRSLVDTVDALLHMGRDARSVELEGERLEITAAVSELIAQASGRDKGVRIGQTGAVTERQKLSVKLLGVSAALERMETWVRRMDEGQVGPYTKYFLRPVLKAVYEYRAAKGQHIKQLVDLLEPRRRELYGKPIEAPELNYTFQNKAALLHAILHSGNDSNLRKLLLGGRGKGFAWGKALPNGGLDTSRWDAMIQRMAGQGILTQADFDLAQSIWDMLEATKGPAQLAHRKLKGFYFPEVEITGIDTPFGRYKGGYVPAISDRLLNADKAAHADADAMGDLGNAGMLPSVARGFTKARVEYNQPLELNLALLPSHVDKVLKFTYLGPVVRQVTRLAIHRDFKEAMHGIDPTILNNLVIPWLHRVSRQTLETPSTDESGRTSDWFWRGLRRNVGLQAMAGNIVNALQQITGLGTAAVRVRPGNLMRALVTATKAPRITVEEIKRKSPLMRERFDGHTQDLMHSLDEILADKWVGFRLIDKANRYGYFAQAFMQSMVDRVVWLGAYEQAITAGRSDDEAVLEADSVIRTTQGSFAPEDASKFEAQTAFVRCFTLFYSYFNTQANLLRSEVDIAVRDSGWRGASPRLFGIYFFGALIPAVLAEAIVQAAKGELGDDDEDDGLLDDIAELFMASQIRYFAAMVPGLGQFATYAFNLTNGKPYDDRLSTSPVFSAGETIGRTAFQHAPAVLSGEDLTARAIRDALTALGTITGLPLGQLAKPLGYAADVASGEQEGETIFDWARGLLSGREAPRP